MYELGLQEYLQHPCTAQEAWDKSEEMDSERARELTLASSAVTESLLHPGVVGRPKQT